MWQAAAVRQRLLLYKNLGGYMATLPILSFVWDKIGNTSRKLFAFNLKLQFPLGHCMIL